MHIAGLVIMYKPFLSIEDQVALLNARGPKTDSRTAWILEREGYYSVVNGYKTPFLDAAATGKAQQDRYHVGATFDDMYALYIRPKAEVPAVPDDHHRRGDTQDHMLV